MQDLFTTEDGMRTFVFKKYIIGPRGELGEHSHPWEHVLYILEGTGTIHERTDGDRSTRYIAIPRLSFHIPIGVIHRITNPSLMKPLIFLSIIPIEYEIQEEKYESA